MQGMLSMDEWPRSPEGNFLRRDYFAALRSSEAPPEYFVVIKRFSGRSTVKWKEDEALRAITKNFRVVGRDDAYVVFDLTEKKE